MLLCGEGMVSGFGMHIAHPHPHQRSLSHQRDATMDLCCTSGPCLVQCSLYFLRESHTRFVNIVPSFVVIAVKSTGGNLCQPVSTCVKSTSLWFGLPWLGICHDHNQD